MNNEINFLDYIFYAGREQNSFAYIVQVTLAQLLFCLTL